MAKTFNFKDSINMVSAVCGSYATRKDIIEYFNRNFEEDKAFMPEELKQIVRELTYGKDRITGTINDSFKYNPRDKKGGEER